MGRARKVRFGTLVGTLLTFALPFLLGGSGISSGGGIVCHGVVGWCIFVAPYQTLPAPVTLIHNWPTVPNGCAIDSSSQIAANPVTGVVKGDVQTDIPTAPCVAGAYLEGGIYTDTWVARGHDQLYVFWNYTMFNEIFLDCAAADLASAYSATFVGVNLWDVTTSTWLYTTATEPATINTTIGSGYIYANCAGGAGIVPQPGHCAYGCSIVLNVPNAPTTGGNTYETFAWFQGVDPSGTTAGTQLGDTAFGCYQMDWKNYTALGQACGGQPSYGATLSSVHIL